MAAAIGAWAIGLIPAGLTPLWPLAFGLGGLKAVHELILKIERW